MGKGTLSEKLLLAVPLVAAACSSNHRVSPWGTAGEGSLRGLFQSPDLGAQIAAIEAETASLGLSLETEMRGTLPLGAGAAVIRAYQGRDALGRASHAVRVATPRGVVMAVGPLEAGDLRRDQATELVPALVRAENGGGAFRSGSDLNGDLQLDVVLRNEAGALSIWHVTALGAAPYAIEMRAPATRAIDLDEDGWVDLAGEITNDPGDRIAPTLTDVASFDGARYSNQTRAARAFHAARAVAPKPTLPGPAEPAEKRLRGVIERAFHAVLAGQSHKAILEALDQESVPAALMATFDRHRARIAALGPPQSD